MSVLTAAIASFAAAAALAAGTPAAAAEPYSEARSVEVRHGDLDLTRAHDVARLNRRIAFAADKVCGNYDPRDFADAARAKACRTEALAAANAKVELAVARANGAAKLASAQPARAVAVR